MHGRIPEFSVIPNVLSLAMADRSSTDADARIDDIFSVIANQALVHERVEAWFDAGVAAGTHPLAVGAGEGAARVTW